MDMKSVLDLKPFLPAENYVLAKQFYLDLGFSMICGVLWHIADDLKT
jgi:hypothetical protein